MKKILLSLLIFCLGISASFAQEVKDDATYYYNIFDNNSTGSLTFLGGATLALSTSATNSLTVTTGRCLNSTTVATAGRAYASYVPIGTSLANDDWEWSFLYRNTTAITTDPSTIANGSNNWRYWLMADGTTSGTASGFYITEYNGVLSIRYKYANDAANPNNYNTVVSYTLPALNATYAIKVQRLAGGLFKLYVDQYSATIPEAKTLRGSNSPGGGSTYNYSMLECSSTTAGRFKFDELKMYTRQFQFVAYNAGLTTSPVGPGAANTIVYSVALKMRGNYEFKQLQLTESPGATSFLTSENLYKSADATFTPATPAPDTLKQTGGGSGYYSNINDVYQSSGSSTDGSLSTVGYYYIAGTTKSPLTGGTLTISGIFSITTKDFDGAPSYTGYNAGGSTTTPITFAATTLSYTSPQTYTVGTPITTLTPTTTGSPTSYSTTGLPPGLSLNTTNGQITGTPTIGSATANYTVTATNASGSGSTTINITVNGPPVISYATPQIYTVSTAITTLSPTVTGGAVSTYGYGSPATFASITGTPYSVATDASGNVYSLDYTNGNLYKYTSAGTRTTLSTALTNPVNVAIDGLGNIWVSDFGTDRIYKISSTGTITATISGVNNPYGIAIDNANNVYVADNGNSRIVKIAAGTTTATSYVTGLTNPYGVALDASGNIFVSSYTANTIVKIPSGSTTASAYITAAGGGLSGPRNMFIDPQGNLFVADFANGAIKRFAAGTTTPTTLISGLSSPRDVSIDPSGNMFIASSGTNSLLKSVPTGGYFLNTALPTGLSFNTSTGQITGTPTVTSSATSYTVTAWNAYGSGSASINITINPAAPVVTYTSPQVLTTGVAVSISPNSTGGAVASYAITPTSLPAGLTFSTVTGVISGTPTAVSSVANYTVTATNVTGTSSPVISITVNAPAPAISYTTPQVYNVGIAISTLAVTSSGGTVVTYSVSPALPAGLSLNTSTGAITGTPTASTASATYTVTATNTGGSDTFGISITVNGYLSNYAYRMPITLNTTAVTGVTTDQTNFPVLLKITDPTLVYNAALCTNKVQAPNGPIYDFAFTTSSSGTELNYQVESYDQSAGTLLVWVRIPTLTYATNNSLLFYFGNTSAASIANHTSTFYSNTWTGATTALNYSGVWHFNETPSTATNTLLDATAAGNNLKASNAGATSLLSSSPSSFIGNGLNLSSTSVSDPVTGYPALNAAVSMSVWARFTTAPTANANVMTTSNTTPTAATEMGFRSGSGAKPTVISYTATWTITAATAASTFNWHHLVYTYTPTGTTNRLYVDGVLAASNTTAAQTGSITSVIFGDYLTTTSEPFNGSIDEGRVIGTTLSADWIKFEYANQSAPTTFATTGTVTADATNVLTIKGGVVYTYSAGVFTPDVSGAATTPTYNGNESFVFASSASLSSTNSMYGVTVNSGATLAVNGQTLNVACNVINNGNITYGTTASNITFNGTAAQSYTAAATTNTGSFGTMTINNTNGSTVTITGGPVDIYDKLVITKGNLVINSSSTFTLKSTATLTASIPTIGTGYTLTGTVTAERYLAGFNRGYRLISAPVATTSRLGTPVGSNSFDMKEVIKNSYISGPGTVVGTPVLGTSVNSNGFDYSPLNNPSIFIYKESDVSPASINISTSEYKGFASMNEYVPMGNGVLFYMRGDRSLNQAGATAGNAFTSPYPFPNATTLKFVGTVISGDVPVYLPSFKSSVSYYNVLGTATGASAGVTTLNTTPFTTAMSYTANAGNKNGYNLVGNPYPSTIDLEQVTFTGTGFGAAGAIGIYTLNKNNTYSLYVRAAPTNAVGTTNGTSANSGSRYILSGQGFFVKALSAAGTITFKETAKTTYPTGSGVTGVPNVFSLVNNKPMLRVKLVQDTLFTNETLFTFGNEHANDYDEKEDIPYFGAPSQTVFLYSVAPGNNSLVYNQMGTLESIKEPIKLYADGNTTGIYKLEFSNTNSVDPYYRIFLKDAFTKDSLEITANNTYTFNINRANAATYGANRFTLVVCHSVLGAYQLVKFTGDKANNAAVKLTWETKNESTAITFNVERSIDGGKTYTDLGMIQSSGKGTYSFTDIAPVLQTESIYRLKQADVNDAISYSPLVTITPEKVIGVGANTIVVYPNPATEKISVDVSEKVIRSVELQIVNSNGKVVKKVTFGAAQHFEQNVSDLLPGAYIIDIVETGTKRKVATTKFIKI